MKTSLRLLELQWLDILSFVFLSHFISCCCKGGSLFASLIIFTVAWMHKFQIYKGQRGGILQEQCILIWITCKELTLTFQQLCCQNATKKPLVMVCARCFPKLNDCLLLSLVLAQQLVTMFSFIAIFFCGSTSYFEFNFAKYLDVCSMMADINESAVFLF